MESNDKNVAIKFLTLAVRGAIATMVFAPVVAMAEGDDDVAALTNPTSTVTVGAGGVSSSSNKFGEYNGLHESGGYLVGGFDVKGGSAYGAGDGTLRWSARGSDLGTTSREFDATVEDQGGWKIGVGFDELRHYTTTNYQTPYLGSMGGNNFTLPANFGVVNTSKSAANTSGGATLVGGRSLDAAQLGDFNTQDVYTQRENTKFNAAYTLDQHWNFKFDFNHLEQTGAKLIGSGTDTASAAFGGVTAANWKAEAITILMTPTNYRTETFNAEVNWNGSHGFATAGYYGSIFQDEYSGVTWSTPYVGASGPQTGTVLPGGVGLPTNTMSTPPSNQFHQLNLKGGYNFTDTTHFVGGLSYGRNTQDESFAGTYTPGTVSSLTAGALDAVVIMSHADAKLTNQATKDLSLTAAFKYNERNNETASNLYHYETLSGDQAAAWNVPLSNRKTEFNLAADYRVTGDQKLHVAFEYEDIQRWCDHSPSYNQIINSLLSTAGFSGATLQNAKNYYANGTSCVAVPESNESRLVANYRFKVNDELNLNAGVSHGDRQASVNSSFYSPIQSFSEGFENPGFQAFFDGSRREDLIKVGASWQALNSLSLGVTAKYRKDNYYDSNLGVGNGTVSSLNFDATYAYSDKKTVSAYTTWQWRQRELNSEAGRMIGVSGVPVVAGSGLAAGVGALWFDKLSDNDFTFGINGRQKELFGGRFDLGEDLTYSMAKTSYNTSVDYATTGCLGTTAAATSNQACGSSSPIQSDLMQFKLTGNYHVDKASSILVGFMYQHLKSNDYYYNALQYPNNPTSSLPTNQQAPNYSVTSAFVAYQYSFR